MFLWTPTLLLRKCVTHSNLFLKHLLRKFLVIKQKMQKPD